MTREELIEEYTMLVKRYPDLSNREVARRLGMRETTLERALTRARTAGQLDIRRFARVGTDRAVTIEVLP